MRLLFAINGLGLNQLMEGKHFVLFHLRLNLPLHTGLSALKRSGGYAPAAARPVCLASLTLKTESSMQCTGWCPSLSGVHHE